MNEQKKPGSGGESPEPDKKEGLARRDFLNEVTFGALGVAGLGSAVVTYQYFSPNVLFEPPTRFRAGRPDQYPVDSPIFLQDQQVYIVRTKDGFYAVSAICTHLGCITQWKPEANQIACPCHGSKFERDGKKIEGPAPLPLPHFLITLSPDGELVVDKLETIKSDQVLKV
ncbi:MAG TPA: Rieske 2Fe-2S domain-containing protein [Candidatus Acidoferrales bacterium]|nr:Rieske 2Fe-2S domain-containing protein [Candidatus Acidoferrales bacterium]